MALYESVLSEGQTSPPLLVFSLIALYESVLSEGQTSPPLLVSSLIASLFYLFSVSTQPSR